MPKIRRLIYRVGINPMGLRWQRFFVAVDPEGRLVGCGQVKRHGDGSRELASIAVAPERRGQGVAREIIQRLIDQSPGTLYLTCRPELGQLYQKFGFQVIDYPEMPPYFRRISRIARFLAALTRRKELLLVMRRQT